MLRRVGLGLLVLVVLLVVASFALRPPTVSPEVIASRVTHTPELLEQAWALPAAKSYRRPLHWQRNGSLCGPASLANVFASLGIPATDEDAVLARSGKCWTGACIPGLTLDELADIARLRASHVSVHRNLSMDAFRSLLLQSNEPRHRYIVNFDRKVIFGSGGGHHSPIGGYLEAADLVLVLDVNEKFKPWLVERSRLFAAIDGIDSSSGKKRGVLEIGP